MAATAQIRLIEADRGKSCILLRIRAIRYTAPMRLEAIAPMLEFSRQSERGQRPTVVISRGRNIRTLEELAHYIAERRRIDRSTVWLWYCKFKKHGYSALGAAVRGDKGTSRFFVKHQDIAAAVSSVDKSSAHAIYEALRRDFKGSAPSYMTVLGYVKTLRSRRSAKHKKVRP